MAPTWIHPLLVLHSSPTRYGRTCESPGVASATTMVLFGYPSGPPAISRPACHPSTTFLSNNQSWFLMPSIVPRTKTHTRFTGLGDGGHQQPARFCSPWAQRREGVISQVWKILVSRKSLVLTRLSSNHFVSALLPRQDDFVDDLACGPQCEPGACGTGSCAFDSITPEAFRDFSPQNISEVRPPIFGGHKSGIKSGGGNKTLSRRVFRYGFTSNNYNGKKPTVAEADYYLPQVLLHDRENDYFGNADGFFVTGKSPHESYFLSKPRS